MLIIGCDFHSRFQQIAMLDPTTGEVINRRLEHENGEAKKFYATLPSPARVGMEATCDAQWFERTLREDHQLWIGDAAEIRAAMVRKQKTDPRDALHILDLLLRTVSPNLGTFTGGAGPAANAAASAQTGSLSDFGDEPTARLGHGARPLPEEKAVDGVGERNWKACARSLGQSAPARTAAVARSARSCG